VRSDDLACKFKANVFVFYYFKNGSKSFALILLMCIADVHIFILYVTDLINKVRRKVILKATIYELFYYLKIVQTRSKRKLCLWCNFLNDPAYF